MSNRDDDYEPWLQEQIRLFPEQFPRSIGGLGPEIVTPAERLLDERLPYENGPRPADAFDPSSNELGPNDYDEDPADQFGVHALDDGEDTFDEESLDRVEGADGKMIVPDLYER